jgi:hypothetical protein
MSKRRVRRDATRGERLGVIRARRDGGLVPAALRSIAMMSIVIAPQLPTLTYPLPTSGGVTERGVLTSDGTDAYTYSSTTGTMNAAALGTNQSGNLRTLFWPSRTRRRLDDLSCATWSRASTWQSQQGVALRLSRNVNGVTHALTVTKNIWDGATWIFNVHAWDTGKEPVMTQLASFDLSSVFRLPDGSARAFPWRMCARVVGAELQFKAWVASDPEPNWGAVGFGGQVALEAALIRPGRAGWYIGHLPSGATADFTELGTWVLEPSSYAGPLLSANSVGGPAAESAVSADLRVTSVSVGNPGR